MEVKINTSFINKKLDNVYDGMKEVYSFRSKESVAKAIFTVSSKEFVRQLNGKAIRSPRKYHHLYEWGKIGDTKSKLFQIRRTSISGGNLKISPYFLNSTTKVPIPEALTKPGYRKGNTRRKTYVNKRFVFREKAQIMELGQEVGPFSAKSGKALVFLGNNGKPLFIRKPITVTIKNPGGKETKGSFFKQFEEWFRNPAKIEAAVNKSGYYKALERAIAKTISNQPEANVSAVRTSILEVSNMYAEGATRV